MLWCSLHYRAPPTPKVGASVASAVHVIKTQWDFIDALSCPFLTEGFWLESTLLCLHLRFILFILLRSVRLDLERCVLILIYLLDVM